VHSLHFGYIASLRNYASKVIGVDNRGQILGGMGEMSEWIKRDKRRIQPSGQSKRWWL